MEYEPLKHQLKVHLGLEKDEDASFDPTEFQGGGSSDDDDDQPAVTVTSKKTQVQVSKPEPEAAPAEATKAPATESKPLSEDDFMAQIQGIDIE